MDDTLKIVWIEGRIVGVGGYIWEDPKGTLYPVVVDRRDHPRASGRHILTMTVYTPGAGSPYTRDLAEFDGRWARIVNGD
jgi:hypothetical protein